MTYFSTEFPQRPGKTKAQFAAQVVAWLRGTNYSTIFDGEGTPDLDGVAPVLNGRNGEELRFRSLDNDDYNVAIGFRHDFPDNDGRLWRTETVCRRNARGDGQDLVRLRTQCIARTSNARLDAPKKPFLLKNLLVDGWGGSDKELEVCDQPLWLRNDEHSLYLANAATIGDASHHLPLVFVSAASPNEKTLTERQISKLAYDLGGVAHVLAEPDRNFSFDLRDRSCAQNVYGGAIGIVLPGRGLVRRFFLGGHFTDPREIHNALCNYVFFLRSQMPAEGWDWTDLQEQALRQQRAREKNRLNAEETEALYEEEIANLREQVTQLKNQIVQSNLSIDSDLEEGLLPASFAPHVGPECYPGEAMDRIRVSAKMALSHAERDGLDGRSIAMLQRFATLAPSAGLVELLEDVKRVTKDPKRMAGELSDLLCRHGYSRKPQSKHVVLEPHGEFRGMDAITISTSPSDARGLKNMRKQVERALGLTKLSE